MSKTGATLCTGAALQGRRGKDHQTAARLRRYFAQIMEATNHTLNVRLESQNVRNSPGRPKKQRHLKVGLSPGVIYGSMRIRKLLPGRVGA